MQSKNATPEVAVSATSTITGYLKWTAEHARCGSLAIAIRLADSPREELVGISLTKTATERFEEVLGETIFKDDVVSVTVRSEDVEADLAAGVGAKGHRYFIGTAVAMS